MGIKTLTTAALAGLTAAVLAQTGGGGGGDYVTPTLILDPGSVQPGGKAELGVSFKIAEGWHLYWRNAGDTGMPISVRLTLPEGVTAGEPFWPAPHRHLAPGGLLDYIYEDEVTLVYPLQVDPTFTGDRLTIKAAIDFLVCDEVCLPGFAEVERTFPVGADSAPGPSLAASDTARFESARARRPVPLGERRGEPAVTARWSGRSLLVESAGADELIFMPYETPESASLTRIEPAEPIRSCIATDGRLELAYPEEVARLERVRGVLDVRRGKVHEYVLIDLAPPGH